MNKYSLFGLSVLITILITLTTNAILDYDESFGGDIAGGVTEQISEPDNALSIDGITGLVSTYIDILFFRIDGYPALLSLIFVPLQLVNGVIIGEFFIKALDVVIPF